MSIFVGFAFKKKKKKKKSRSAQRTTLQLAALKAEEHGF